MARLGDVFEIQITGEWGSECTENETGTKVLRTTNFTPEGRINYDDVVVRSINESKVEKKRLHCGDIILEKSGGTEKTPVGRVVFCDESIEEGIYLCNNFTQAMRVNQTIAIPRYVFYFMWNLHCSGRTDLLQNKTTGIRNLQVKSYLNEECPLPTLDEQRKIAAILDKVSDLIAKRRQQLDKLDEIVKAKFVEMFGDPLDEGCRYQKVPLGVVADVGSSKRIFEKEYVSSGVPFYRTKEIVELSKGHKITTELFITKERFAEICDEYGAPQKGDLLISAVGTIGVIWIVDGKNDFYFKDGNLLRVSVSNNFNPVYLKMLLEALIAAHKQKMSVGTAYAALTISMLKEMMVYLVPIDEQNQFAAFVKQTEKIKATISRSLEKLETLKKALMQEYFG